MGIERVECYGYPSHKINDSSDLAAAPPPNFCHKDLNVIVAYPLENYAHHPYPLVI